MSYEDFTSVKNNVEVKEERAITDRNPDRASGYRSSPNRGVAGAKRQKKEGEQLSITAGCKA
jgi:hypothetical protein